MKRDLIKVLLFDTLIKAAIKRLFIMVPFLGWGPIGIVVSFLVQKFADMAYEECKESLIMSTIKFKNEHHQAEFDKAFLKLKHIEKTATQKEIEDEIRKAQDALAKFVRHDRM